MGLLEEFRLRFPELKNAPDDLVTISISDAENMLSEKYWRGKYQAGVVHLAAHYIFSGRYHLGDDSSKAGYPVMNMNSKTVGSLSVGYNDPASTFGDNAQSYAQTVYGQRYLELLKTVRPFALVI